MGVSVDVDLEFEFAVKAPFKDVFDVLSDVPTSASFYPKVDKLIDLGDGAYRWEMQKVGTQQVNIQTVYASKYVSDRRLCPDPQQVISRFEPEFQKLLLVTMMLPWAGQED